MFIIIYPYLTSVTSSRYVWPNLTHPAILYVSHGEWQDPIYPYSCDLRWNICDIKIILVISDLISLILPRLAKPSLIQPHPSLCKSSTGNSIDIKCLGNVIQCNYSDRWLASKRVGSCSLLRFLYGGQLVKGELFCGNWGKKWNFMF